MKTPLAQLLVAGWLALGTVAGADAEEPEAAAVRKRAEQALLRGSLGTVSDVAGGQADGRNLPAPLDRWRPDLGWEARPGGRPGLAPLVPRPGLPCTGSGSLEDEGSLLEWPLLRALLIERCQRETLGAGRLPDDSPLANLPDTDGTIARFLSLQRGVYRPVPPEQDPDAAWAAAARASREKAESLRSTSHLWAALAAGLLLGLTLLAGLLAKPRV